MKHPVYDLLLQNVSDELEKTILMILVERAGERVSRPELIHAIYGFIILQSQLGNCPEDRQIREAIGRLQAKDYPIIASSGVAGYKLTSDEGELDEYIAEIGSRVTEMIEKEKSLRRSRRWVKFIREYKLSRAEQLSMWNKPTVLP